MGFSNEDNCCQSQGIEKLIKEKREKVFSKLINLLMSLQYKDSVKFIVNICEQTTNFVYKTAF